jgi:hypothetical protein
MSFEDKSLQCSDCGTTFTFTAEEQEFFKSKGYVNEPKRCPSCRQARKSERYGGGGGGYGAKRQMFPAVVVRQVRPFKRPDGTRLSFHDNAAVIMTPEGELKGTEIRGPVAKEAAERWPMVANLASIII